MAGDRIRGILPAFPKGEEDSRPPSDVASHRWRILINAEDADGQVKGLNHAITLSWITDLQCSRQANDWGAMSRMFT